MQFKELNIAQIHNVCNEFDPSVVGEVTLRTKNSPHQCGMLLAHLFCTDPNIFEDVFGQISDSVEVVREFIGSIRSGFFPRKSLGTRGKRIIQFWLNTFDDKDIGIRSVDKYPTLGDIIRLAHPKPINDERKQLFSTLLNKNADNSPLCTI